MLLAFSPSKRGAVNVPNYQPRANKFEILICHSRKDKILKFKKSLSTVPSAKRPNGKAQLIHFTLTDLSIISFWIISLHVV